MIIEAADHGIALIVKENMLYGQNGIMRIKPKNMRSIIGTTYSTIYVVKDLKKYINVN